MNYTKSKINSLLLKTKEELREHKDFRRGKQQEQIARIIDSAVERIGEIINSNRDTQKK